MAKKWRYFSRVRIFWIHKLTVFFDIYLQGYENV